MSRIRTSILIFVVLFAPAAAVAQSWPTAQPIKAIITFSAGSASDVIARAVFDQVSTQIGQTIVVENRVGAGGTLGANVVAKAPPDGYTLLVHTSSHTVTAATYAQLPYDAAKDFTAVIPWCCTASRTATPCGSRTLCLGITMTLAFMGPRD